MKELTKDKLKESNSVGNVEYKFISDGDYIDCVEHFLVKKMSVDGIKCSSNVLSKEMTINLLHFYTDQTIERVKEIHGKHVLRDDLTALYKAGYKQIDVILDLLEKKEN